MVLELNSPDHDGAHRRALKQPRRADVQPQSQRQAQEEAEDQSGTNELSPPIFGSAHPASFLRVTESVAAAYPAAVKPLKVLSPLCAFQYLAGNEPTNAMFITPCREN